MFVLILLTKISPKTQLSTLNLKVFQKNWAAVKIEKDADKNLFPIKMRDPAISMAYNYLKARGLFPDGDDSEDEDEMVFGDDDFP